MKLAIFYHALFYLGDPPELRPMAVGIVMEQMEQLKQSGLLDACDEMIVGVNGGVESEVPALMTLPAKAKVVYHGLASRAENLTIVALHEWCKTHLGWAVLYFHAKGCTHPADSDYGKNVSGPWRRAMMDDLVGGWRNCMADMEAGYDVACSHWLWGMADGTQHIPCGNFAWVRSSFAASLPDMHLRERIKQSGIGNVESRYEAEVFWGNGRKPTVKQYRPNGGNGVP